VVNIGCFVEGTLILMSDFTHKKIEDIQLHDEIVNQKGEFASVVNVHDIPEDLRPMAKVIASDHEVECTNYHPILTTEGWKAVDDVKAAQLHPELNATRLQVGDTLITIDENGMLREDVVINIETEDKVVKVYNFEVNDDNTYSANGIIVHNKLFTLPQAEFSVK